MQRHLAQTRVPALHLYNSLTQKVEAWVPHQEPTTIYVCGITPYATTHLGHVFTYAATDTLIRYLESQGVPVTYVQNLTDIDNSILQEAQRRQESWQALGRRCALHFMDDMQTLNIRPPDAYPRATEVIPEIIAAVEQLVVRGVAYESHGSVYFHVPAWPQYGQLSRLSPQAMLAGAQASGDDPQDPNKRNPLDFPLWQAQQPGEPAWESPWGPGRPGWHIECSTMAGHLLGDAIDIHGGGSDLLFPHHDSEIAQAERASGRQPFVRCWFHVGMVQLDGEKMSKSRGNLVMVRDVLETYSADGLRVYLAMHHYRQPWEHNAAVLQQAEQLAQTLRAAAQAASGPRSAVALEAEPWRRAFQEALQHDLHTPRAIEALSQLARAILAAAQERCNVDHAQRILCQGARLFGLRLAATEPEARVRQGWDAHRQTLLATA